MGGERQLFGRDGELNRIAGFVGEVRAGRGGLVVVAGAPGIGKTSLAEHAAERAAAAGGITIARGAAWDTGDTPPLWPWSQILRSIGRTLPASAPGADRFAQLEAIAAALAEVAAAAPVLVVLDDLHAADPASMAALRVVVDDARSRRLGVIATRRDVGLDAEVASRLERLDRLGDVIPLRGVDSAAARALVGRRLAREVPVADAEALVERTGGNPFLMQEIAVSGGATRGVRDAVLAHLGQLDPRSVAVLGVAATIGRVFDHALLAACTGAEAAEIDAIVARAAIERILHQDRHEVRFAHALLRDTLYDALAPAARAEHHARIADALAARGGRAAEIARHLRLASTERKDDARTWTRRAIDGAAHGGSADELADAWDAWLQLGSVAISDRVAAGEAALAAGRRARATQLLSIALDEARATGDRELESRAVLGMSGTIEFMHRDAEQVARIEATLARDPPRRWQIELLAQRARHAAVGPGDAPARRAAAERALALAEPTGDDRLVLVALDACLAAAYGADSVEQRLAVGERMLAIATRAGLARSRLDAMRWLLGARAELGRLEGVEAELDEYQRLAEAVRAPGAMINARMRLAARAWQRGRWDEGLTHAEEAYAIGRRIDDPQAELAWVTPRLPVAAWRGDEATVLAGVPIVLAGHKRLFAPFLPAIAAWSLSMIGRRDEAWPLVAEIAAAPTAVPDDFARLTALAATAEVIADVERAAEAATMYELLLPYAARNVAMGAVGSLGSVAHRLGRLARVLGRRDDALRWLRQAIADHERWDAQPMLARSRDELARVIAAAAPATTSPTGERRAWLAKTGEGWRVGLDAPKTIADRKGLAYIATLVARPGEELDALTLVGGGETVEQDGIDVLDAAAIAAYRRRLDELRDVFDDATARGALARADKARAEIEAIEDELTAARGLGGRARTRGGNAERARSTVTVAIRRALDAIAATDPGLADHLRRSIRTGHRCAYVPDPNLALRWQR